MSLFKRLFGGSSSQRAAPAVRDSAQPPNPKDPANDPNMIRAYDAYGREIFISKDQWRTKVLPGTIQTNWNKPDELYDVIVTALKDGFRADVIDAAEQLYKIDSDRGRGTCVWGIVLMEEGRLDEADKVFRDFTASHGV